MAKRKTHLERKRGDAIKLVVKSNELVEARYMFNVWETRFFHTLISIIDKEDADDKVYRVWFKDIKENFGINSNKSYDLLREAARSLNRKPVYIGWMDDEYRRGREYTLFEFVDYLESGQSGDSVHTQEYVEVKIQERMRPFLLHVKKNFDPLTTRYTSYDLRNTQKLKPYAIRIYELLKQFEYKGFRTIEIQDLKDMFLITDEYPRFSSFNQSVIRPSIRAINKHTDLYIDTDRIEHIKKGKKVFALRFPIASRNPRGQEQLVLGLESEEDSQVITNKAAQELFKKHEKDVVLSFGVTGAVFFKMLSTGKYGEEAVARAVRVTRRARFNQEITKNVAGFFLKALKQGFMDTQEAVDNKKQARRKQLEEQLAQLKEERSLLINQKIKELTAQNEAVTLEAIDSIKQNPITEALIIQKEQALGRKLSLSDYREDENLRLMVINSIIQTQQSSFEPILAAFNKKIGPLRKELTSIK